MVIPQGWRELRLQYPLTVDMLFIMVTPYQIAEIMKREIVEDVLAGRVSAAVGSFAAIHDYVDANCYGDTEALLESMHDAAPRTDLGHIDAWNKFCGVVNPAMEVVDAWIKDGGILACFNRRKRQ